MGIKHIKPLSDDEIDALTEQIVADNGTGGLYPSDDDFVVIAGLEAIHRRTTRLEED